jgi:hypothetical protein
VEFAALPLRMSRASLVWRLSRRLAQYLVSLVG